MSSSWPDCMNDGTDPIKCKKKESQIYVTVTESFNSINSLVPGRCECDIEAVGFPFTHIDIKDE